MDKAITEFAVNFYKVKTAYITRRGIMFDALFPGFRVTLVCAYSDLILCSFGELEFIWKFVG